MNLWPLCLASVLFCKTDMGMAQEIHLTEKVLAPSEPQFFTAYVPPESSGKAQEILEKNLGFQGLGGAQIAQSFFYRGVSSDRILFLVDELSWNDFSAPSPVLDLGLWSSQASLSWHPPSAAVLWGSQGLGGILSASTPMFRGHTRAQTQLTQGIETTQDRPAPMSGKSFASEGSIWFGNAKQSGARLQLQNDQKIYFDFNHDQMELPVAAAGVERDLSMTQDLSLSGRTNTNDLWKAYLFQRTQDYDAYGPSGNIIDEAYSYVRTQNRSLQWKHLLKSSSLGTAFSQLSYQGSRRADSVFGVASFERFEAKIQGEYQFYKGLILLGLSGVVLKAGDSPSESLSESPSESMSAGADSRLQRTESVVAPYILYSSGWGEWIYSLGLRSEFRRESEQTANDPKLGFIFGGSLSRQWLSGWGILFDVASGDRPVSFYQKYSEYGNRALLSEKESTFEAHLLYRKADFLSEAIFFVREIGDAIFFDLSAMKYLQRGVRRVSGWEVRHQWRALGSDWWIGYSDTNSRDLAGRSLPLLARQKISVGWQYCLLNPASQLNLSFTWLGPRELSDGTAFPCFAGCDRPLVGSVLQADTSVKMQFRPAVWFDLGIKNLLDNRTSQDPALAPGERLLRFSLGKNF